MTIGTITVDLLAKTGSFETDINRSAKLAAKRAKEIDDAVSKAGERVGASLGAAGVAAVYFGKRLIDGLDALNDYKDATGASIENLSALEDLAGRTGAGMDTVSGILVKFNNVLKEADGKNGVSLALKAIGLNAEELKRLDPAEALRVTAVALSGFADDGNKARLVQELFGKSVKEAAPFLNDLAQQTALVGKVTAEQTQAAEDFNKQLFAIQKNATDAGRSLLNDLLPSMNLFLQNAREIGKLGGFGLIVKDAAKDLVGLGKMTGDNGADIKQFMRERDRLQKDLDFASRKGLPTRDLQGDLAENARYLEILRAKQLNEVAARYAGDNDDATLRKFSPQVRSVGDVPKPAKAGAAHKESEFQKYLENLGKQLDKTKELTVAEMTLADIAGGRLKLAKGESAEALLIVARQVDAAKAMEEYKKLSVAGEDARAAALLKSTIEQENQAHSLVEGNKSLIEEIQLIGKSAEVQAVIEQARITSSIAIKEEELARRENADALIRETDAIRAQITALNERKDLVGLKGMAEKLKTDADEAKAFATQIGAAFESSFEKAILEGGKLSDVLTGLAKDVAALYIRNSITGPMAKSIGKAAEGFDFGGIVKSVAGLFGIPGFAEGGDPPVGRVSMVGENGPELFVPKSAGTIIPNHALGGSGAPLTVHQHFTVGDVASISMLRDAVAGSERRIAGALGRSRQYGGALV